MTARSILVEACVDSVESGMAAEAGGARRLELCASLVEGGTSPSAGMIAQCRARVAIPIYVMIRPRGGDFLYSELELEVMERDIHGAKLLGADGVVFGLLLQDGRVDIERTMRLIQAARPLDVTFHRAIDVCRDPIEALDALMTIGVDRVLTSGQAASALAGSRTIALMVEHARGRLIVLPGGGVNERNAARVVERTGTGEIHVRGAARYASAMTYRSQKVSFRGTPLESDFVLEQTDAAHIRSIVDALK
ncbi:MAG: copper homeostasis protein CutC [Gemmatimonadota bacterium]